MCIRDSLQCPVEKAPVVNMMRDQRFDITELHESDGGSDVVHMVLVTDAGHVYFSARRGAVDAEPAKFAPFAEKFRDIRCSVAGKHAAVHCGQVLDRLQGEHDEFGVAPDASAFITRAKGVGSVFNYRDAALYGDLPDAGN